jgi:hypothetical protein
MALLTSTSFYSNAIVGVPQVGSDIKILETHTNPRFSVGFGFTRGDGNKYRYGHFGATCARGTLVSQTCVETSLTAVNKCIAPASAAEIPNEKITAGSIGSRYIQITLASVAQNQFAGGYLSVLSGTGVGFTYRIRGNSKTTGPATGDVLIELYSPIIVAISAVNVVSIVGSMYTDLTVATALVSSTNVAGVTTMNMTAGTYGWICTHGVCNALQDAVVGARGDLVRKSIATNGAIAGMSTATATTLVTSPIIGYLIEAGASTEQSAIYLQLE